MVGINYACSICGEPHVPGTSPEKCDVTPTCAEGRWIKIGVTQ